MGSALSKIQDDMDDYQWLCDLFDEEIQHKANAHGLRIPDCYGSHSEARPRWYADTRYDLLDQNVGNHG